MSERNSIPSVSGSTAHGSVLAGRAKKSDENDARASDRERFVRLLMRHDRMIRACLRGLLPTAHDVDEVMQEVSVMLQNHQIVLRVEGVSAEHHNLSHHDRNPAKIAQLKHIEVAILKCSRSLFAELKGKTEGAAAVLDATSALFGSSPGNADSHDPRNLPILLAGGGFQHARYVARDEEQHAHLCNLFVSMLNSLGVETDAFGQCNGALNW